VTVLIKKLLVLVISASLLVLAIGGCGRDSGGNGNETGKTLVIGEMWAIDNVDPATDGTLLKEKALVVETLVECKPNFELIPGLAESWKNINDKTWEIKLKDGVKFHDGTPLNAQAVKWSLERALQLNPQIFTYTQISNIKAVDDKTLSITTSRPNGDFPASLHYSNTAIISPGSVDQEGKLVKPVGTGPFKFAEWNKATGEITLVKNADYHGGAPKTDRVLIKPIPDPNTRSMALEKGEIDFTCDPPYNELNRLSSLTGIKVEKHETARNYELEMNLNKEPFNDIRVRKAISHAIDRESLVRYVLFGCGSTAKGPFMPGMAWTNGDLKGYPYDTAKAGALLAEAGFKDSDGNGILEKNGRPLKLSLLTYPQRPGLPPMAQALQDQLKKVGIDVKVEIMEYGAITQRAETGEWDMRIMAMATAMIPTPAFYGQVLYYSNKGLGYHNDKVDQLIDACSASFDSNEKYRLAREWQQLVEEDLPVITLAHYGVAVSMNDKVQGYVFNPTAHDYNFTSEVQLKE
jgi:peptide/nickel transport system substrate-binding protein